MGGSGLVIAEIRLMNSAWPLLPQQQGQRHDIGLLAYLRLPDPLSPDEGLDLTAPMSDDVDILKVEIAFELFEQAGLGIKACHQCVRDPSPRGCFIFCEGQSRRDPYPIYGSLTLQNGDRVRRAVEIPACHNVRVGIVVDGRVILIRADDRANVSTTIGFDARTTRPESCGFDQNLR